MMNLDGHEAGNGGHSQRTSKAYRGLLYSETYQRTTRFSSLQPAWQTERQPRVEAGVRGEQLAEAVPRRLGSGNGIKRREKADILPHNGEKICYKPPTGLLPARPNSKTNPQTAGAVLAKTL